MDVLFNTLGLVAFLLFLPLSFIGLFVLYMEYPGLFERMGMGRREVGLLLVGATIGLITDFPIIIHQGSFLALNLGGAIIPIVISAHLYMILKDNLERQQAILFSAAGLAFGSIISFLITDYQPSMGVVAEFPEFLVPPFASAGFALLLFKRNGIAAAPMAYITGSMGALIGADIVRIPQILGTAQETGSTVQGSIGGAGIMDMVFLSGLLAFNVTVLFASREQKALKRDRDHIDEKERAWSSHLHMAELSLQNMAFKDSIYYSKNAVDIKLSQVEHFMPSKRGYEALRRLGFHSNICKDYKRLEAASMSQEPGFDDARKGLINARYLIAAINAKEVDFYAKPSRRITAFVVDFLVMVTFTLYLLAMFFFLNPGNVSEDRLLFWLLIIGAWGWGFQTIYFSVMEWRLGSTLGKLVTGITVLNDKLEKPGFITVFTRNVVRFPVFFFFLYGISLFHIMHTQNRQRHGDYIARTVVVDKMLAEVIHSRRTPAE